MNRYIIKKNCISDSWLGYNAVDPQSTIWLQGHVLQHQRDALLLHAEFDTVDTLIFSITIFNISIFNTALVKLDFYTNGEMNSIHQTGCYPPTSKSNIIAFVESENIL